jgi:hypothetical protein
MDLRDSFVHKCTHIFKKLKNYTIFCSHCNEDVDIYLLSCNGVWTCRQRLTSRIKFSPDDRGQIFLRNNDIYLQVHTALKTGDATSTTSEP